MQDRRSAGALLASYGRALRVGRLAKEFVRRCGGDVDTIAGAIWGAANGTARLPAEELGRLEQRERLAELAAALWARATNGDRR